MPDQSAGPMPVARSSALTILGQPKNFHLSEINELESYVYGVLMQATMGASDDQIKTMLKEDGLAPDRISFAVKVAEDIMQIASDHAEPIKEMVLAEGVDGDESQEQVKRYLREQGVREEYLEHILVYNSFVYSTAFAQQLIEEGRKEGKSEKQLIATIKQELEMDQQTAEDLYHSVLGSENLNGGTDSGMNDDNHLYGRHTEKKSVITPLIKGLVFVIAGIVNFSMEYGEGYWSIIVIVVGIIYLVTAVKRRTD